MEPRMRVFVTLCAVIVLIVGLYVFTDWFSKVTGYQLGEDQKMVFAGCLNEKGTFYFTQECAGCEKQAKLFGANSYAVLNKIECGDDRCGGLASLPAWELNGKAYYGFKGFKELSELSGCALN